MIQNKKGFATILVVMALVMVFLALMTFGKDLAPSTWFYEDVQSGTAVVQGCEPEKYVAEFSGTVNLINDMVGFLNYEITYIDAHIDNIDYKTLSVLSNDFTARVCLFDVLNGNTLIDCYDISDAVTKGRIEKFPFTFRYNMYDNDCNGEVDDHTLNLVTEINSEDGYSKDEKTVAILNGKPIYQNVDY